MQRIPDIQIAKVNLNLIQCPCSPSISLKRQNYFETASKRLKYCYQRKQQLIQHEHSFSDRKYFDPPSWNEHILSNQSNLLNKLSMGKQTKEENPENNTGIEKVRERRRRKGEKEERQGPRLSICNFAVGEGEQINKNRKDTYSCRKATQNIKRIRESGNQKKNKINPYTKEQYLYFRRKEIDKLKKKMQDMKKYELQTNILKPCRIFQKELNQRNSNKFQPQPKSRPKTAISQFKKRDPAYLNRTLTAKSKQQQKLLEPWESIPYNNFEGFLE